MSSPTQLSTTSSHPGNGLLIQQQQQSRLTGVQKSVPFYPEKSVGITTGGGGGGSMCNGSNPPKDDGSSGYGSPDSEIVDAGLHQ